MVLKKIFGSKEVAFDPSIQTFPDINTERLGKGLSLEKRGAKDGASGLPTSIAESMTSAEQEVVAEVRKLRKRGLEHFELQINAYENRITGARAQRAEVELLAGELHIAMQKESDNWRNHLTNEENGVREYQEKLDAYREKHGIMGPPRKRKNFMLMFGTLLVVLFVEVALSGTLFAQKNEMGQLGGMGIAFVISLVNVLACLLLGFGSRFFNLKSVSAKLFGGVLALLFVGIALGLNISVAHFRDALESFPWDEAAFKAVERLRANSLGIQSFNSWIVFAFGLIVSVVAYLEGLLWLDAHPGYNRIYEDAQDAIESYAEAYDDAQKELDDVFANSKGRLCLTSAPMGPNSGI